MAQAHLCHRIGHAIGLIFIRRTNRLARGNRTKSARPRANVPENHERSRAMLPAFAHIRAAGAFADGMQVQGTHQALQVLEPLSAKEFHTQPIGSRVHVWRRHRWCRRMGEDVKWRGHGVRAKLLFYAQRGPGYKPRRGRRYGTFVKSRESPVVLPYLIFATRPWVGNFWNCNMS